MWCKTNWKIYLSSISKIERKLPLQFSATLFLAKKFGPNMPTDLHVSCNWCRLQIQHSSNNYIHLGRTILLIGFTAEFASKKRQNIHVQYHRCKNGGVTALKSLSVATECLIICIIACHQQCFAVVEEICTMGRERRIRIFACGHITTNTSRFKWSFRFCCIIAFDSFLRTTVPLKSNHYWRTAFEKKTSWSMAYFVRAKQMIHRWFQGTCALLIELNCRWK